MENNNENNKKKKNSIEIKEQEYLWEEKKRTIFGLPISFTKYKLCEDRLIISKGFLNVVEDEVMLFRVSDFQVTLSFFQKLFKVGTVKLSTSDSKDKEIILQSIKLPREVKQFMSDKVMEQRKIHDIKVFDKLDN